MNVCRYRQQVKMVPDVCRYRQQVKMVQDACRYRHGWVVLREKEKRSPYLTLRPNQALAERDGLVALFRELLYFQFHDLFGAAPFDFQAHALADIAFSHC